ncbi:FMN-dependent oxidoreductase, nitrilotriacetate monooxygenase family [Rhodococcus rhodochrous J3]|uniref:FMN-dependent oxidoreductase, nitrilotriacetate monooxygenase family n=2 Tax=Rhodococcus rhodochrous TaxID=1829 RepID=A0ABY1MCL8_RHORH|nr:MULTISPECIES: NtaA/DmoA family FMN-dependent monooxygenase [Rhodococcus]MBF4481136.1 NtaA/DmoA family FMN-dependent monooxygenase [Rhodococcus rhodochrous]MDC3728509.1 NtaA/DmoA family FMN-dependent monooxygenase [Rhodococcus sp. Rp3]WSE24191.1 NtaA/DmoA family FMN-dependent monooxygenase [Rhodococcus sp. PD04]SMG45204.1 FMN-dependent oxidoreductase, nitrilotriacetate monooxygenase family [Rhodococcus rhodochrous J3]
MFHMGWFLSYTVQNWRDPWNGNGSDLWIEPELYIEAAKALERAGFDYMMFEDGSFIPDAFRGSMEYALSNASIAPKHDPLTLIAPIARETERIGLIATVTTSFYPPFLAARLASTLDTLSGGRFGINLVTAHNDRTAQNFGLEQHHEHDLRYEMADEWVRAATALWDGWERDALTLDEANGVFASADKVHYANFEGTYYRTRGPLNLPPSPQLRPVLCQAGGSQAGMTFGARHADTIIAQAGDVPTMKKFRETVRELAQEAGRDPDSVKILFLASFVLEDSDRAAQEKDAQMRAASEANIEANLAMLSFSSGIDFGKFDLDAPVPEIETNAARATTAHHLRNSEGRTLREIVSTRSTGAFNFVGSVPTVADQMSEVAAEVGGDGFLVQAPIIPRTVHRIADGLAPELRRRGLIRADYDYHTLRENLLAF